MKKIFTLILATFVIASCSNNATDSSTEVTFDLVGVDFYNEFFPCEGGADYTPENVTKMMQAWRSQNISDDLLGAWGYAPAADTNGQDNGWWELSWESKEKADAAWAEWVADEGAMQWAEEHESVISCDGEARRGWVFNWHRDPYSYGQFPDSGQFFTETFVCKFNEGKSESDLANSIALFNEWLDNAENYGSYAYGTYMSVDEDENIDFLWLNFHESADSQAKGAANWLASGGEAAASIAATATCRNPPDYYDSWTLYDPARPQFSKRSDRLAKLFSGQGN